MSLAETLSRTRLNRWALRAANGDAGAFRSLYRALHPVVWGYVSRRIASRADAEDLVARVFERVVEHLGRFDPERGSARAWVLRIARNAVIDHYRAKTVAGEPDALERIADAAVDPSSAMEADERENRLREALAGYPPQVREMFALRFADGLRVREIASLMELSEAAVKQRFSRTIRELRARLGDSSNDKAAGYAI